MIRKSTVKKERSYGTLSIGSCVIGESRATEEGRRFDGGGSDGGSLTDSPFSIQSKRLTHTSSLSFCDTSSLL